MSATGAFIGTPFYASPEQVQGQELDHRSDLYSLGATLYELLTGRPPFQGQPVAVVAKILSAKPAAPSSLNATVPKALDRVVMRLLAKDPDRRYASHRALRRALTPFAPGPLSPAGLGWRYAAYSIDSMNRPGFTGDRLT